MSKKKMIPLLLLSATVITTASLALTGCKDKTDGNHTNDSIEYNQGNSIIDSPDVEYTLDGNGDVLQYVYTGKKYEIKYLVKDNTSSYVTLTGEKLDDLKISGFKGAIKKVSLKEIEENVKVENSAISVTGIEESAFRGCDSLEEADLSKKNTALSFEIGDNAFVGCTSLKKAVLPDQVYTLGNGIGEGAFTGCSKLTDVTISEKFSTIGDGAFAYCQSLRSIKLPNDLTVIGNSTFYMCDNLAEVTGASKLKSIKSNAFNGTSISNFNFGGYSGLVYIGTNAFANTHFNNISLPDTVTYIGVGAFKNIEELSSVTIPFLGTAVNHSASWTFKDTYGLEVEDEELNPRTVTVSVKNMVMLPAGAFNGSDDVTEITVNSLLAEGRYNVYGEDGVQFERFEIKADPNIPDRAFAGCKKLNTLSLPEGIKSIGDYAFSGCRSLNGYTIPSTVKSIGNSSFANCRSLNEITLPTAIERVGNYAFKGCSGIRVMVLPSSLKYVGSAILSDCTLLESVTVESANKILRTVDPETETERIETLEINSGNLFGRSSDLIGDYTDMYLADNGLYVPETLTSLTLNHIYAVGGREYFGFKSLESVIIGFADTSEIPQSIAGDYGIKNSVGEYAFKNCFNLETLTFNEGKLASIGSQAFYGCRNLKAFTIPSTVTNVGAGILGDCISLSSLTIEKLDGTYTERTAGGNIGRYYSLTPSELFSSNSDYDDALMSSNNLKQYRANGYYLPVTLKTVNVNSVCKLPDRSFYGWEKLVNLTLKFTDNSYRYNNGVDTISVSQAIDDYALYGCYALSNLNITNSQKITAIGDKALYGCRSLTSFTVPENVTSMGTAVLGDCYGLTELTIKKADSAVSFTTSSGSTRYQYFAIVTGNLFATSSVYLDSLTSSEEARQTILYQANGFYVPNSLRKVTVDSVCELPNNMFNGWEKLTEVKITFATEPITNVYKDGYSGITVNQSIGDNAFSECSAITSFSFTNANKVKNIGERAFASTKANNAVFNGFTNLSRLSGYAFANTALSGNVTLTDTLEYVERYVFYNCKDITGLTISDYNKTNTGTDSSYYNGKIAYLFGVNDTILNNNKDSFVQAKVASSSYVYVPRLTSVTLSGVNALSDYALGYITTLKTLTINPTVINEAGDKEDVTVGAYALKGLSGLETLNFEIPAIYYVNVNSSDRGILYGTNNLKAVKLSLPASVSGSYNYLAQLFSTSSVSSNISLPESLIKVELIADETGIIPANLLNGAANVTQIVFDKTKISQIGANAFTGSGIELTKKEIVIDAENSVTAASYYLNDWIIKTEVGNTNVAVAANTLGIADGAVGSTGNIYFEGADEEAYKAIKIGTGNSALKTNIYLKNTENAWEKQTWEFIADLTLTNDSTNAYTVTNGADGKISGLTSTNKTDNSTSICRLTADGELTVTFDYRVSSESKYDKFTITLKDASGTVKQTIANAISGAQSGNANVAMSAGDYLEFKYSKDSSNSNGDDCGYVSNIVVV